MTFHAGSFLLLNWEDIYLLNSLPYANSVNYVCVSGSAITAAVCGPLFQRVAGGEGSDRNACVQSYLLAKRIQDS